MNYKIILVLTITIFLLSNVFATYSGFNVTYNTQYPTRTTYYTYGTYFPSFAQSYTTYGYYPSIYYNRPYYTSSYTNYSTYYPNYQYVNMTPNLVTYYSNIPTYNYTTIARPAQIYPTSYRNFHIYRNNDGWGFGISTGTICTIYGYC
jgi:hypothetical protein